MPEVFCVDAVGARIGIDLSGLDEVRAAAIRQAWADAAADGIPDVVVTPADAPVESMLSGLSQLVTITAIDAARGQAWMLHAAGLANETGEVVVLVGPSGRGKTTASRVLGREFGYVSDETVAIEESGRVRAYRKPLSVIEDPALPKAQVPPSAAGLRPLPDATLRVCAIVLLDRRPDHDGAPEIEVLDLGDALGDLVEQSSFLTHADAPLQFIADVASAAGGVRRVVYREADELVPVIAALMDAGPAVLPARTTPAQSGWEPASAALPQAVASTPGAAPRFRRADWADHIELHDPDRVAVLSVDTRGRGTVRVLAGIAPAVWRAADGASLDELAAAAVAAYGTPPGPDAAPAVLVAVGALLDAGLLVSDEPRLRRRDDVAWVDRDDRVYALALDDVDGRPRLLEGTAAVLWDWLDDPVTLTQLSARATEQSGALDHRVAEDVAVFVAELVDLRLVAPVGEPGH
ncbi:hypothetical protein Q9S36_33615 [Microbacterium sp. ARD31]|uniref:PqqD family peptide modification chaperone n=1 Tax=Microbacterium sp. ARD31 TaxID=2962576 RepID=UPI0028818F94|nr:PqqD family peptide modification chaperone [Microbacterium sp. ARD31]MDT0185132.1 hypothetical protein [Microbacterium sp. ARD31]